MPIEMIWIGGVLVAGLGTLIFALFGTERPIPLTSHRRQERS